MQIFKRQREVGKLPKKENRIRSVFGKFGRKRSTGDQYHQRLGLEVADNQSISIGQTQEDLVKNYILSAEIKEYFDCIYVFFQLRKLSVMKYLLIIISVFIIDFVIPIFLILIFIMKQ